MLDAAVSRLRAWGSAGALLMALAVAPGSAVAASDPAVTSVPEISGTAQVGQTLTSTPGTWEGQSPITPSYQWLRCSPSLPDTCTPITDATGLEYVPVAQDAGQTLRIELTVTDPNGQDIGRSEPTAVVVAPQAEPPPPPTEQQPPPTAQQQPPPPTDSSPAPAQPVAPPVLDPPAPGPPLATVSAQAAPVPPQLLDPFPVVRFRGRLTADGVWLTLLSVRAPWGTNVSVSCSGAGCPTRRTHWAQTRAVTRVGAFEGPLPAGVRLVVRAAKPGWIGKHTVISIRRGKPPSRRDRCLDTGSALPRPCPN
jgi:hypothetical protein